MQEKSAIGTRQTSVHLNGEVTAVDFGHDYKYYAVRNDGTASIYVSTENSECTVGANGVVCVPAGGGYTHYNGYGGSKKIYLSGNGAVTVIAQDDASCPFKSAPVSGGGEGGDADTVNGHTVDADVPADAKFTDTTYDAATQTEDGLMSAEDKTKLDGIEEGANKTVVDTALSGTSTNPVQNKVINAALNGKAANSHTHDSRYYTEAEIDAMLDEKAGKDAMTGATSSADGMSGLVPSPSAGNQEKFLRADGTWDIAFSYDYVADNWLSPSSGDSYWHTPSSQGEGPSVGRYVAKPVKDLINGEDGYIARIITVYFPYSNTLNNYKGLYLYEYSQHQYTIYHNTSIEEQGFGAGDIAIFFSCRNKDKTGQFVRHHLISVKRAGSIIFTDFFKEFMFSDSFYETFNSNLKIKHGNMSFTRVTSATQYDVTFDTPFENVPNIQVSYTDSSGTSSSYVSLISSSKTGFSVKGSYLTGFNWLAIGV